jgi:hypothetical protein
MKSSCQILVFSEAEFPRFLPPTGLILYCSRSLLSQDLKFSIFPGFLSHLTVRSPPPLPGAQSWERGSVLACFLVNTMSLLTVW